MDVIDPSLDLDQSFDSGFGEGFKGWSFESLLNHDQDQEEEKSDPTFEIDTKTVRTSVIKRSHKKSKMPNNANQPRRSVGRPRKVIAMPVVAEIPRDVSEQEKEKMKKRRMRDLNNIASQRCRAKKRMMLIQEEKECEQLEKQNVQLKQNIANVQQQIQKLKTFFALRGIPLPQ